MFSSPAGLLAALRAAPPRHARAPPLFPLTCWHVFSSPAGYWPHCELLLHGTRVLLLFSHSHAGLCSPHLLIIGPHRKLLLHDTRALLLFSHSHAGSCSPHLLVSGPHRKLLLHGKRVLLLFSHSMLARVPLTCWLVGRIASCSSTARACCSVAWMVALSPSTRATHMLPDSSSSRRRPATCVQPWPGTRIGLRVSACHSQEWAGAEARAREHLPLNFSLMCRSVACAPRGLCSLYGPACSPYGPAWTLCYIHLFSWSSQTLLASLAGVPHTWMACHTDGWRAT